MTGSGRERQQARLGMLKAPCSVPNLRSPRIIAVAIASVLGGFNGILVTSLRLNPLIVTLGTMSIYGGSALVLTGGLSKPLTIDGFNWLGSGRVVGVPVPPIIMLAFCSVSWWVMTRTRFGREIYAFWWQPGGKSDHGDQGGPGPGHPLCLVRDYWRGVGNHPWGNARSSRAKRCRTKPADRHRRDHSGGTSLLGGRGSVWDTVLAVLILGTLNNGLTLLDVSSFWQEITRGIVLIAAVAFDQIRGRSGD